MYHLVTNLTIDQADEAGYHSLEIGFDSFKKRENHSLSYYKQKVSETSK